MDVTCDLMESCFGRAIRAESNLHWREKSIGAEEVETMNADNSCKKVECKRNER